MSAVRPQVRSRDGRDKARLFRQYRLAPEVRDLRRCDLDPILEADQLEVLESWEADCGYAACLVRPHDSEGAGIFIAAGQSPGRKRFSLAHELGHFHLPSHRNVGAFVEGVGHAFTCADRDLRARASDAARREWEANDFAAELLMPYRLFSRDVERREATFRTVVDLGAPDQYDVSLTAAAWRLVETTREACALVVSVGGQVEWVVRSEAWRYPLVESRRAVPPGSAAAAVSTGESPNSEGEQLDPLVWLASPDGRWVASNDIELFESTHAVPRLKQVLSLIWAVNVGA